MMQHVILLLLYVDDVVLFSYDIDSMQHLLGVLEEFCHSSGLVVNVEKTKMMAVQTNQENGLEDRVWMIFKSFQVILCSM